MKGQSDVLVLGLGEMPLKFSSLDLVEDRKPEESVMKLIADVADSKLFICGASLFPLTQCTVIQWLFTSVWRVKIPLKPSITVQLL